jgi:hypothetical protein
MRPEPVSLKLDRHLAVAFAFVLLHCAVYDNSLRPSTETSPVDGGGADSVSGSSNAAGASGDAATGGAQAAAGSTTQPSAAGESSGGAAGTEDGASSGAFSGGAANTTAGAGGASATAGVGGTLGSAGVAGGGGSTHELAQGKPVTASTQESANVASSGNDGNVATRWCASSNAMPQWWRVDLGAVHQLSQVSIQFEHPDKTYSYFVEVSQDDAVYTQQGAASGTGAVQTMTLPASVSARYLRLTVTKAVSPQGDFPFASFFELSVLGI